MSGFVRRPHHCPVPGWANVGDVWQCDCGRRWKFKNPGNPSYAGWSLTWLSFLGKRYGPVE